MKQLDPYRCMKCGGLLLARPDKIPFCSECEKKFLNTVARVRPDLGKVKLVSETQQ